MLIALIVAGSVVLGAHPVAVLVLGLVVLSPRLFLVGALAWGAYSWWTRSKGRSGPDDEAELLRAISAELSSGSSLRVALNDASARVRAIDATAAVRLSRAGAPFDAVATELQRSLPTNGRLAAAALRLSARSGARVASVFDALASRASGAADLARETRAATAQARMSAGVVGLVPIGFTVLLIVSGSAASPLASGTPGLLLAGAGAGLQIAGLRVVAFMLRRGRT